MELSVAILAFLATGVVGGGGDNSDASPVERGLRPRQDTSSSATATTPDYFQVTPELFTGPESSGKPPFLAETNPAPFAANRTFVPNTPLETAVPISGNKNNASIFQLFGQLSSYFPNPDPEGFGVNEYPLPKGSNISQVHMLSRHGARYPTSNSSQEKLGRTLVKAVKNGTEFTGKLSFLNSWTYDLGAEIMVRRGWQELFDSGVLHYYDYGALWDVNKTFVVRTTTQKRMRESAEYFLTGFAGFLWNANPLIKLEFILEASKFNDSLVAEKSCPNADTLVSSVGNNASAEWQKVYLKDATQRLKAQAGDYNWSVSDSYNAQGLCAYETVAFGYSRFCDLFTFEEWQGYEYSIDISFAGNNLFQSPTARAVGSGYVQEVLARLDKQYVTARNTSDNVTLDSSPSTFPLNQSLYFDFSHDTNIASILTAFGLTQFATFLPTDALPRPFKPLVSRITPFGTRLDIEIINAPHPVRAQRAFAAAAAANDSSVYEVDGPPTSYVHFVLNQRTVPLGASFGGCDPTRRDGWCELGTFRAWQRDNLAKVDFERDCYGDYKPFAYGAVTDGVPPGSSSSSSSSSS